jgi:hypothetical protein
MSWPISYEGRNTFAWSSVVLICWEGWYKASRNINITYLSSYDTTDAKKQPRQKWSPVTSETTESLTPTKAGQYTLHVRTVLKKDSTGEQRRSTYGGRHTYLVK